MKILDDLEALYAGLSDTRVTPRRLTRRSLLEDKSPAGTLVWHLYMGMRHFAGVRGLPGLPVAKLSPLDELAREWVDRARCIAADWRESTARRARRRMATSSEG